MTQNRYFTKIWVIWNALEIQSFLTWWSASNTFSHPHTLHTLHLPFVSSNNFSYIFFSKQNVTLLNFCSSKYFHMSNSGVINWKCMKEKGKITWWNSYSSLIKKARFFLQFLSFFCVQWWWWWCMNWIQKFCFFCIWSVVLIYLFSAS